LAFLLLDARFRSRNQSADFCDSTGGKKHLAQKADMFNMVQNGTEVAEATYKKAGSFVVNDVTPADFASTDY